MGKNGNSDEIVRAFLVLNLLPPTTLEEVEKAYKRLAALYHPDRPGGDPQKFQEIQEARAALQREGEKLGNVRLMVGSTSSSPFDDMVRLQDEVLASKKQILDLKREQREDQEAIAAFRARSKSKIQLSMAFSALCLCAITVLAFMAFGDRFNLLPKREPAARTIAPGSFPAYEGLGEVSIQFEFSDRDRSTVTLIDPGLGELEPGATVELEPGGSLVDGTLVLPADKRFRIRASDLTISLGRGDQRVLEAKLPSRAPSTAVLPESSPSPPDEASPSPDTAAPDPPTAEQPVDESEEQANKPEE